MVRRAAIFIDAGHMAEIPQGRQVDLSKFPRYLVDHVSADTDILRCYYYCCPPYCSPRPTPDESKRLSNHHRFLNATRHFQCFEVRQGQLARYRNEQGEFEYDQKMVDVLLSIDLVRLSSKAQISHAVIVTGDSDFAPAIQVAKNEGVSTWLFYGYKCHVNDSLLDVVDGHFELTPDFLASVLRTR